MLGTEHTYTSFNQLLLQLASTSNVPLGEFRCGKVASYSQRERVIFAKLAATDRENLFL